MGAFSDERLAQIDVFTDSGQRMTIAKRLVLLLAVPLLALVGLGVFTRLQLTTIETRSRFVADFQVPSLAALGNISRTFSELRVLVRNHVLATSDAERASVRSTFDREEAEFGRLLARYEGNLISDDRDRRLLTEYRDRYFIFGDHRFMRYPFVF